MSDWHRFQGQLDGHLAQLRALHEELGGDQQDPAATIMHVVEAALEASLAATRQECAAVRQECATMLADMHSMRLALGETAPTTVGMADPFSPSSSRTRVTMPGMVIQPPLLQSQKRIHAEWMAVRRSYSERVDKIGSLFARLRTFVGTVPDSVIQLAIPEPVAKTEEEGEVDPIVTLNAQTDVSLHKLGQIEAALSRCARAIQDRKRQVQQLSQEIIGLWAELAVDASALSSELDQQIMLDAQSKPELLGLSDAALGVLEAKRDVLLGQRQERVNKIQTCTVTVKMLHAKLKLPPQELVIFMSRTRGASQNAVEHCERELARLTELKRDHIADFVHDSRKDLEALWDQLYIGEDQRLLFEPFFEEIYTDTSLLAHEQEIERLQAELERQAPLLTLLDQHMQLATEREQLVAMSSNPNRFRERGYNPMAESKLRAKVEKRLPKVENALRAAFETYTAEHGVPFLVWGETYLTEAGDETPGGAHSRPTTGDVRLNGSVGPAASRPKSGPAVKQRPRTPGSSISRPPTTSSLPTVTPLDDGLPPRSTSSTSHRREVHSTQSSSGSGGVTTLNGRQTVRPPVSHLSRSLGTGTPVQRSQIGQSARMHQTETRTRATIAATGNATTVPATVGKVRQTASMGTMTTSSTVLKERAQGAANISRIPGPGKPTMLPLSAPIAQKCATARTATAAEADAVAEVTPEQADLASCSPQETSRIPGLAATTTTATSTEAKPARTRFSFRPVTEPLPFELVPRSTAEEDALALQNVVEASFEDGWGDEGF